MLAAFKLLKSRRKDASAEAIVAKLDMPDTYSLDIVQTALTQLKERGYCDQALREAKEMRKRKTG